MHSVTKSKIHVKTCKISHTNKVTFEASKQSFYEHSWPMITYLAPDKMARA